MTNTAEKTKQHLRLIRRATLGGIALSAAVFLYGVPSALHAADAAAVQTAQAQPSKKEKKFDAAAAIQAAELLQKNPSPDARHRAAATYHEVIHQTPFESVHNLKARKSLVEMRLELRNKYPDIKPLELKARGDIIGNALIMRGEKERGLDALIAEAWYNPDAWSLLTTLYLGQAKDAKLKGVGEGSPKSLAFFKKSAEFGMRTSQFFLGNLLVNGLKTKKDVSAGLKWLEESDLGDAHLELAQYWRNKTSQNYSERAHNNFLKHLRAAAERGHPKAIYNLGIYHQRAREFDKARFYFEQALKVDPKSYKAMLVLGDIYMDAFGDPNKAMSYYMRAANDGNLAEAQFALGIMHLRGIGVAASRSTGIAYLKRAAQQGYGPAVLALKEIEGKSNQAQQQ